MRLRRTSLRAREDSRRDRSGTGTGHEHGRTYGRTDGDPRMAEIFKRTSSESESEFTTLRRGTYRGSYAPMRRMSRDGEGAADPLCPISSGGDHPYRTSPLGVCFAEFRRPHIRSGGCEI